LYSEELHNWYSSPNIIKLIKSRRMRWEGHMARMGEESKLYRVWWESLEERDLSEDQGVVGEWDQNECWGDLLEGAEWIKLSQTRGLWRAVVCAVMNLLFWRYGISIHMKNVSVKLELRT
jgi:hypothetical protein